MRLRTFLVTLCAGAAIAGCEGAKGPPGAPGADGANGSDGASGADGASCSVTDNHDGTHTIACDDGTSVTVSNGASSGGVAVKDLHGTQFLESTGEFAAGKYMVKATITSATADAAGVLTVNFTVADLAGSPVTATPSVSGTVAKLVPAAIGERSNRWVPYTTRLETVTSVGDWPNPVGTTAVQGNAESNGTLTNHGDGSYTYVFATNLAAAATDGQLVGYERNRPHRVSIMLGGHAGATADASFDFVPDGTAATDHRAIVETATCKSCHGEEFHGHGGNRLSVENCVTCHAAGTADANGGESLDFKVMIHKIHAGGELQSLPGADGKVWDDPTTPADESADNGRYAIWGYKNQKHEWWKAEFPAVLSNCRKCHQGTGADVDAWKTKPSRAACGSCHDLVNFATGDRHVGGVQADDSGCASCHTSTRITSAHDWLNADPRNVPEFDATLTVSAPANGQFFAAGEAPVVTIKLKDHVTGVALDHTTVVEDDAAEGCTSAPCPRDGKFASASLFVSGPRARRVPVLTTAARAQVLSAGQGPWDLSAAGAALALKVDNGQDVVMRDVTGGDFTAAGTISVPVGAGAFATPSAATASEIAAWLNANAAFKRRAIAFVQDGRVGVRSRNLGRLFAVQLQPGAVATAVFGGDTAVKVPGQFFPLNNVAQRINPANDDPKAVRTPDAITYTLDPVDDLAPGTYVASIEMTDGGRVSATNYRTPTVAKVAFQVKTATPEKPIARNCSSCHQGPDGKGFVLDFSRHYKIFSDDAVDQCGACHDYQPQVATGTSWSGGRPISKRVHAVHFGSSLFTPLATVDYSNGDPVPGRNWNITFPQDVRNCQTCHPDGTTSGTWAAKPNRLACLGCHDSEAAKAHVKLQTFDPTPNDAFSGDEEESCQACH